MNATISRGISPPWTRPASGGADCEKRWSDPDDSANTSQTRMPQGSRPTLSATITISDNAGEARSSRRLLTLLLCAMPFVISIRMLSRANTDFQIGIDFRMTYTAARAWLLGENPYDDATLKQVWANSGMPHATPPGEPQTPNVYPLSIAPLLAPLAWMPFPQAFAIWLIVNAAAMAFLAYCIISAGGDFSVAGRGVGHDPASRGRSEMESFPLIRPYVPHAAACVFLFGFPLHYGAVVGNLAIVTTLLVVLTLRLRDMRPGLAGILYGLALVKYSLCAPLALVFAIERRWRLLFVAAGVQFALLGGATLGFASVSKFGWVGEMLAAGVASMDPGAVNHFASLDYTALHIELPALLYRIAPPLGTWGNFLVAGLTGGMLVALVRDARRPRSAAMVELRYIAMMALTMIAFYHRVYDAILVIAPLLAWLLRYGRSVDRRVAIGLWVAALVSIAAGATIAGGSPKVSYPVLAFGQMNVAWAILLVCVFGAIGLARIRSDRHDADA